MDALDRKIIHLLTENARMPVKEIAQKINLTSPAVSSRIHRLEQEGITGGYTLQLHRPHEPNRVGTLVSVQTSPGRREEFLALIQQESDVLQCYRVTGTYNFIVKVSCANIEDLEHLLNKIQQLGTTNTQIILATQLDRRLAL